MTFSYPIIIIDFSPVDATVQPYVMKMNIQIYSKNEIISFSDPNTVVSSIFIPILMVF
jgi:hypothetical protein